MDKITKTHEVKILKIVEWAQRLGKQVETLTESNIREALREKEDGD